MQSTFSKIHKGLSGLIGIAVFVQMFLAGIWHAGVVAGPEAHVFFGLGILAASLLAFVSALIAKKPRQVLQMSGLLFVLILLQPILIEQRRAGIPLLSAFHTLNAAFIGLVSGIVLRVTAQAANGTKEMNTAVGTAD